MRRPLALLTLALGLAACGAQPAPEPAVAAPGVRLVEVGRFDQPLYVASPPKDTRRLFVVEQGGRVRVVRGGRTLPQPFLDLRAQVTSGGEQGLLSIAFAPDYAASKLFYVYFTDRDERQRIVEFRASDPDRADPASARTVLVMDDPEANHNGGLMLFGPDGMLYVATGDGGGGGDQHGPRGNAQNLGSLLGKILRIDPRGTPYRVPADNPFVGRSGARPEVYSFGLRNPWRFSFDRRTGDLTIGDVGQSDVEEIDFVRRGRGRGANFGWRPFEGSKRYADGEPARAHVKPVIEHTHDAGFCSITGGVIVRDPALKALTGRYLYGDFCEGRIRSARLKAGRRTKGRPLDLPKVEALASFGEDARGRVYVISLGGTVHRFAAR